MQNLTKRNASFRQIITVPQQGMYSECFPVRPGNVDNSERRQKDTDIFEQRCYRLVAESELRARRYEREIVYAKVHSTEERG